MQRFPLSHPVHSVVRGLELVGLIVILIATFVAAGQDIAQMIEARRVTLADLLLLFLYLEVLAMIGAYLQTGRLPIRYPIYIGIIALARYLVLEIKDLEAWKMLAVGATMLILAGTVLLLRYGHLKLPYPENEADFDDPAPRKRVAEDVDRP
ncbi:phosphate-starvation-inducible PsiE family protein [Guyparkeria hydrothermalis]|uniref:phosphate-starvation-inducible protein PsiE n=1 Tax=Guyparkeria hydrothermalis TaxID=923 RepID=UPI0020201EF6|nr:phosphate-starvation-inducible PsiE family protein [Guyparkeria hydrothermalis]MCL7744877.1 phosphate-starvation-inducible PsiE family protein [Guyparkeria hydrothermalis]